MFAQVITSHVIIIVLTLFVGFLSYAAFGSETKEIVLANLPSDKWYSVLIQCAYMLNIMGCFCLNTPVIFNLFEKEDEMRVSPLVYGVRRVCTVMFILALSVIFPDINVVLSLFAGSICGTLLFILPVFFYHAAYVNRPSKKDRTLPLRVGYALVAIALPIGILGVIQNFSEILNS